MENSIVLPQQIKNNITIWSGNSGDISKRMKAGSLRDTCTPMFKTASFTIGKAIQVTDKCTSRMWCIYSKWRKFWNFLQCHDTDKSWGHYAKWNKPVTGRQILHNSTSMWHLVTIIKTERKMVVVFAKGGGNEFQFYKTEKVLEMIVLMAAQWECI